MNNAQLRHLATLALEQYGIEHAHLTRLGGASNTNFRADVDDTAYVLRLSTTPHHDRATIASELMWLHRLRTDTALIVPQPIATMEGDDVARVALDDTSGAWCTCMTWIDGDIPPTVNAMTDGQLANAGAVMAALHQQAQHFYSPATFTRPTFSTEHFRQRLGALVTALRTTDLAVRVLQHIENTVNRIIAYVDRIDRTRDTFGLIHADFHSGNYVLHGNDVRIIDFDRCGFGFYVYDLALALMELNEHQQRIFVQGYERVTTLPWGYATHMPLFVCLAYVDNLGFLAAQVEELPFIVEELPVVVETAQRAMALMAAL